MFRVIPRTLYIGLIVGLCLYVPSASGINETIQHIKIATILSYNDDYIFSLGHVQPSIEYAIEQVHNMNLLPRRIRLDVNYSDSQCNARDGPVAAFNYYMEKSVDMYLGPVCDYSLAPIARYASYWNLPIMSPGGFAHNFGEQKLDLKSNVEGFFTLTRIGMTFDSMALSIIHTIKYFGWNKVQLTYNGDGHSEVSPRFCYLAGSALIQYIKKLAEDEAMGHSIFLHTGPQDTTRMLKDEVGIDYAGKSNIALKTLCLLSRDRFFFQNSYNIMEAYKCS